MIKLKPCPFCGEEAELDFANKNITYTDSNGNLMDIGFFYTVKCKNSACECSVGIYEEPQMAIDAWNIRKGCEA